MREKNSGSNRRKKRKNQATGVTINELPMRPEVLYQRFKEECLL